MSCLTHVSSCTVAIFKRTSHLIARTTLYQRCAPSWKTNFVGVKRINLEFHARFYSSRRSVGGKKSRSLTLDPELVMEQEKNAFYVVRKGDIVGIYKSLSDCQAQVGSSICDPPVSVYKGYSLPKDAEEYLASRGLRNALYTIRAADLTEDIFGRLAPCPFQDVASFNDETSVKDASKKRSQDLLKSNTVAEIGSMSVPTDPLRKHVKLNHHAEAQQPSSDSSCCTIEFDGASKGNPGQAGAAAVLRADDGSLICRVREGLGIATSNVAEYRAMILGLKYALSRGYTKIVVRGDSKLVCMQMQGLWKVKNQKMSDLFEEAKKLKDKFLSFQITHVLRDLNSEADAQANLAVSLADGQVLEEP
ncbi:RVT_3 domain-containing protein [Cephalotus follicularis]|uniref:RVT_3 domain-containing protein n=1 Tax=Cephalotus follicularis TaxID=3775 RepID=A0A1Q3ASD0_CEPFO|nr:RVT_3 domain-containing protein [Cephalotus follicularis]